ncbi:hypothetical protein QFZ96_002531 [Paraburkholderia youngii]
MPMWRYAIADLLRQSHDALVLPQELKMRCPTKVA